MSDRSVEILDILNSHVGYALAEPMQETDGLEKLLNKNEDLASAIEAVTDELWDLDPSTFFENTNRLTKVSALLEWIDEKSED